MDRSMVIVAGSLLATACAANEGLTAATGIDRKAFVKLRFCDTWEVTAHEEDLGSTKSIRLSVLCSFGADYFTRTEVAAENANRFETARARIL